MSDVDKGGGMSSRKRKLPGNVAMMTEEETVEATETRAGRTCTLTVIERIITEHSRKDCLKTIPGVSRLETKTLMDSIPFYELLSSIQPVWNEKMIPLVTWVYEEKFMRQCIGTAEKQCVMGNQCECMMIDPDNAFVGVEFCVTNESLSRNGMCVLCLRKITTLLFSHTIQKGVSVDTPIQRYRNICNQEGEYHPSAMLICPPNGPVACMPLPIVAHQRNRYTCGCTGCATCSSGAWACRIFEQPHHTRETGAHVQALRGRSVLYMGIYVFMYIHTL